MRRLAWKTSMLCLTLAGWTALIAALAPAAHSAEGWTWPVRGEVLTRYSNDDADPYAGGMHRGIDIAAAVGTPVVAARSGEVTYAGSLGYSGITAAVRSADGRHVTSYLHLASVAVRRGEQVSAGQRIGEVGTTGRRSVDAPHLHFGVRLADEEHRYVDPLSLLPALGAARAEPPVRAPAALPVAPRLEPARVPKPAAIAPARIPERARGSLPRPEGVPALAGSRRRVPARALAPPRSRPAPLARSRPRPAHPPVRGRDRTAVGLPAGKLVELPGPMAAPAASPRATQTGAIPLALLLPLGVVALALACRALYLWSAPMRERRVSQPPRRHTAHAYIRRLVTLSR